MTKISDRKKQVRQTALAALLSGFAMWVVGGLYHNLIMPAVNENMHPHHEGLVLTLIAYVMLGLLMSYFYQRDRAPGHSILKGIRIGVIIGILWVFPHGLTMAAVHESSITFQLTNTAYHIIEQGIGGMVVFLILRR